MTGTTCHRSWVFPILSGFVATADAFAELLFFLFLSFLFSQRACAGSKGELVRERNSERSDGDNVDSLLERTGYEQ